MLPLSLDLSRLRLALIGNDARAVHRLAWLEESGATALTIYARTPSPALAAAAGDRLVRRWPDAKTLAGTQLVFIADPPKTKQSALAEAAHSAGAIVHVEDVPALCDAHAPAVLRRGDLVLAVSTGGAAPGFAAEVKRLLDELFGAEWSERLDAVKTLRRRWRGAGASLATVRQRTEAEMTRNGWAAQLRADARRAQAFDHGTRGGPS
jgi:precorrin-2 dehydrogenase